MKRTIPPFLWTAIAVLFCISIPEASAQDYWEDDTSYEESTPDASEPEAEPEAEPESDPLDEPDAEEILEEYRVDGRRVYLICLFGERDHGIVTTKCRQMERELDRAYGARWVTRLNNPSEAQMQRIQDRVGHDIAAIIVVTHSTPDSDEESGYDVWDCPLGPDEIADIFDEEWVIWNGCFSRGICELADNILPTQCEDGILSSEDDTWREIMRCLERNQGGSHDRNDICEQLWGDDWDEDWEPEN